MRNTSLALLGLLALAAAAPAQQPPAPPSAGTPEQLNECLANWERQMTVVQSFIATVSRTDVKKVRNQNTVLTGEVRCMKKDAGGGKVDKLALLHIAEKDNPKSYEKFVCTGDVVYWFSPRESVIYYKKLRDKMADDSFLNFLFEMKADSLRKRYDLTLVFPKGPDDPTLKHYVYIDIKPRKEEDKVEFQRARLVLFRRDYMPAQLWFEEPNGDHHTWNLSDIKANDAGVKATDFVAPEKPAGWKLEEAKDKEPEPRPRVVRPKNDP
jgi:TIGR03009 family protein